MILALFDFDGTITTHETMPAFLRASTPRHRLLLGYILLWPFILGYKTGIVSGTTVRSVLVRFAYSGQKVARVTAAGNEFARTYLDANVRPEAMERIQWHIKLGHQVLIVSGGLDVYLQPWARRHGLEVVCSKLEVSGNRLTCAYSGPQCVGKSKVAAVEYRYPLELCERIYAYGDTREDEDLLAVATDPFYREMPSPEL